MYWSIGQDQYEVTWKAWLGMKPDLFDDQTQRLIH